MNVLVPVPDELAAHFGSEAELGRRAVEALALEEYRAGRLALLDLQRVLGFATGGELEGFLRDRATSPPAQERGHRSAADGLVVGFRAFAATPTLGGLDVRELVREDRR